MNRRVIASISISVALLSVASNAVAQGHDPLTGAASSTVAATQEPRFFSFEVGVVAGLNINTSALGLGPNLGLEFGPRLRLGPGFLAFAIRGTYERYSMDGTGQLACSPAMGPPTSPCIESNMGQYTFSIVEQTVTWGLPISYRLLRDARVHPYFQVQPQLVLQRADTTNYDLVNTETATRFGVLGAVGVQVDLGPGGIWLEAGYRYVALQHRATGQDATLGVIAIALGYRFAF